MAQPAILTLSQEVLLRICYWIIPPRQHSALGQFQANPRALVALALSCRTLNQPALDVLWHTLRSPWPLLHTLPEDLCTFVFATADDELYGYRKRKAVVLRDPVPLDFTRLSVYSTRIRTLGFDEDRYTMAQGYERQISNDVWTVLLHAPKPLLPNLQSLEHYEKPYRNSELASPCRGFFRPVEPLLGPSLQLVTLVGVWEYPTRPTEVIKKMTYTSPLVKSLRMEAKMGAPPEFASLSCPELRTFIHLTHFEGWTMNIGPDALSALGSLPKLQDVLLHVEPADFTWDALQHGRHACFFPALTKLTLHNIAFEWCAAFLHTLTSTSLQNLLIRVRNPPRAPCVPDGALFEALCAAIGSLPCGRSLHEIEINFPRIPDVARATYQPWNIAPLAGLKGALRRLRIQVPCQIVVDDATLDAMANAWPDIQTLVLPWREHLRPEDVAEDEERWPRFHPRPEDDHWPQGTLSGLAALVRRCPRLTTLTLALDMRLVPELETPPASLHMPQGSGLQCLSLGGSVLIDPITVSAFLALACPRVKDIGNGYRDEMDWYYARFLRIREQERKWASGRDRRGPHQNTPGYGTTAATETTVPLFQ